MKQFKVRLTETFLGDMLDIMFYILEKSGSSDVEDSCRNCTAVPANGYRNS